MPVKRAVECRMLVRRTLRRFERGLRRCVSTPLLAATTPTTHRRRITGVRGSEHASDGGGHDATLHDGVEVAGGDVREVAGGGGEVGVPELGLDHVEGGGFVEEFDGEGVSQGVWVDAAFDSGLGREELDEVADVAGGQGAALAGGEDVGSGGDGGEAGANGQVGLEHGHRGAVDGDVASFVALAVSDVEGAVGDVQVADLQGKGLGHAQTRSPEGDEDGAVA